MTTFTLGINTCFAVKRWPRPADWAEVVRRDLGLDVVQHSFDLVDLDGGIDLVHSQAADVRTICERRGITVHSTFTGLAAYSSNLLLHPDRALRVRAERWYRCAIAFTAAAGASGTGGHVGAYSVADWHDPERRRLGAQHLRAALDRLARHASRLGVGELYVENLASPREPATMDDVAALLQPGDDARAAIRLCLDVGHQCVPGTSGAERDPYAWLARFGARAAVVHLQQSDADADHHWPFTPRRNEDGRIDAGRVLDVLSRSGATEVALILEVIPPFEADDDAVLADLATSVTYWRQALSEQARAA